MGILPDFFNRRDKSASTEARGKKTAEAPEERPSGNPETTKTVASENPPHDQALTADKPSPASKPHDSNPSPAAAPVQDTPAPTNSTADTTPRRWSVRNPFGVLGKRKPEPSPSNTEKRDTGADAASKAATDQVKGGNLTPADHQAKQSALVVRSLIVGQQADGGGFAPPPKRSTSRSLLNNVKTELLQPETASKVIKQLKALPALTTSALQKSTPIHAVCLPYTDEEVEKKHFSLLLDPSVEHAISSVASATTESVAETFKNLHVVNLFGQSDIGSGHPSNGRAGGLIAEAVPVAETVINDIERVIPQLMTLSYATGKDVAPDHTGIHPPTDRISLLTCMCPVRSLWFANGT
jgi:hypothetical protein